MWNDIPDDPVIQNMERTGYPDGKEPRYPRCPCCGEECETTVSALMSAATAASKRKTHGRLTIASLAQKRSRS